MNLMICSNKKEKHIINKVPYVSQKTEFYCHYASITMLLKYSGIDTTMYEVLHHSGAAHSTASLPSFFTYPFNPVILPPYRPMFWCGFEISQGKEDLEFLANLFGLKCQYKTPNNIVVNRISQFEKYWKRLKEYILNDLPVYATVDPFVWPLYRDAWNIKKIPITRGAHTIIIVGFDENNGKIYFNDPYTIHTKKKNGIYGTVSIEVFKAASTRCFWVLKPFSFTSIAFKKVSDPLPSKKIFEIVHNRNINKLRGSPLAYDDDSCRKRFHRFGINALEGFKNDIEDMETLWKKLFYKFLTLLKYPTNPFIYLVEFSYKNSRVKFDVSQYLLKNRNIPHKYKNDAVKLLAESEYWNKLGDLFLEFNIRIKNNKIKDVLNSDNIFQKIVDVIDGIINIEMEIVE